MKSEFQENLQTISISENNVVCPVCGDFGYRPTKESDLPLLSARDQKAIRNGYVLTVRCETCTDKRHTAFIRTWQEYSRMTDDERMFILDHIILKPERTGTTAIVQAVREMLAGQAFMLTFIGTSGNAKSAALIATVNEFLSKGKPALYITLVDMLEWITDAFNHDGTSKEDDTALGRIQMLEGIIVLTIDEIQDAKETDWRMEKIASLINRRQRDAIAGSTFTLFASNKPIEYLPPQIQSRLRDGRNRTKGDPVIINNDPDIRYLLRRPK